MDKLVGRKLGNKYNIEARLGSGGMSSVYRAHQSTLQRAVAIKVLHNHLAEERDFIVRFEREAASIAQLRHPNIVQVYDFDQDPQEDIYYMVMELIEGQTLRDEIQTHQTTAEPFPPAELVRVISAVASALDFAHSVGMIHRDVKPGNIMFTQRGQVVLADFGLARPLGESNLSQVGMIAGTPHYMSPEQAQGQELDGRTDIYSLGVVLYEMLTLQLPFDGSNTPAILFQHIGEDPPLPTALAPTLPLAVEKVVLRAMAKEPRKRYPTAAALAEALREAFGLSTIEWLSSMASGLLATPSHTAPLPASPYRGLFAFQETDAPFFFGREAAVETLRHQITQEPLVALVGASGSGKSSLIFAGLVPRLREAEPWQVLTMRPGARPLAALANTFGPLLTDPTADEHEQLRQNRKLQDALLSGDLFLSDILARFTGPLLLVVDQFEELYTLSQEVAQQQQFVAQLLTAAPNNARHHILLTLRADFLGPALEYRPLADQLQRGLVVLGPMSREELGTAVEKPAHKQRVAFEDGLVERILDDVGSEPGNLPLLEFALTTLWEKQQAGQLTHATYETIGRVEGALTTHAEAVLASLDEASQAQARAIFTQLVRPGEGTEDTRRIASWAEIGAQQRPLIQTLADARLVVTNRDPDGQETVEVVHEALIRTWARLRGWMQADRTFRAWQERLRAARRQWEESGRDEGALLRGVPLVEAEGWLAERTAELSPAEQELIHTSLAARDHEQARRTREQQARERLGRLLTLVSLAGVLITAVLAVWALGQRNSALAAQSDAETARLVADTQRELAQNIQATAVAERDLLQISLSQQLAIQSGLTLMDNLNLSLLLAIEAYGTSQTIEAQGSLLDSLLTQPGLVRYLHGHTDRVQSVAFSPDGHWLASASSDTTIILNELDGDTAQLLQGHNSIVNTLAFSPDGRWLASGGNDRAVVVWDTTQTPITPQRLANGHTNLVLAVAFDPTGRYLASADGSGAIIIWETGSWAKVATLSEHRGQVLALAFTSNGRLLASAGEDKQIILWDMATQQPAQTLVEGHTQAITSLSFDPTGVWLASGGRDNQVILWDLATGTAAHSLAGHSNWVTAVAFVPNGQLLASADRDGQLRWWRMDTLAEIDGLNYSNSAWLSSLAFNNAGTMLATGSYDGRVLLWQPPNSRSDVVPPLISRPIRAHTDWALDVAFSPVGQRLATAGRDGRVVIWNTATWAEETIITHPAAVRALAFSPDGALLAYGSEDATIHLWDVAAGRPTGEALLGHTDFVQSLTFSPDGRWLASTSDDQSARVWDVATQQVEAVLEGHTGTVWEASFNPSSTELATGGRDGLILFWDVATWSRQGDPLRAHGQAVRGLIYSPDGRYLASASDDKSVIIWDMPAQTIHATLQGHTAEVESVAFSPDSHLLATAGDDQSIVLWDVAHGRPLSQAGYALRGHTDWVFQLVFSPKGNWLASVGRDGNLLVWDVAAEVWVTAACQRANRSLTPNEWQRYFGDQIYMPACVPTAAELRQ